MGEEEGGRQHHNIDDDDDDEDMNLYSPKQNDDISCELLDHSALDEIYILDPKKSWNHQSPRWLFIDGIEDDGIDVDDKDVLTMKDSAIMDESFKVAAATIATTSRQQRPLVVQPQKRSSAQRSRNSNRALTTSAWASLFL